MVPLVVRVLTNKRVGNNINNLTSVYEKVNFFNICRTTIQVMKFNVVYSTLDKNSVEKVGDDNYAREKKS